jgi:hypothetical protein
MPTDGAPRRWEQLQSVVHDLYIKQGLTASEVLTKLKQDHAFNAKY